MFKLILKPSKWITAAAMVVTGVSSSTLQGFPLRNPDLVYFGKMAPTVYYTPHFSSAHTGCRPSERVRLFNRQDVEVIKLCPSVARHCLRQGSCFVKSAGRWRQIAYQLKKQGMPRFDFTTKTCPFVAGSAMTCLKPFFSVAADLKHYPAGTVLFIPQLRNLKLPDGSTHHGYVLVSDSGGDIVGPRRFDFYTGFWSPLAKQNILQKSGFADRTREFDFYIVGGKTKDQIRNFL